MGCTVSATSSFNVSVAEENNCKNKTKDTHMLNSEDKRIIKRTWKILSTDISRLENKVFLKMFELTPAIKDLFPQKHSKSDSAEDTVFKGHATRMMQSIETVINHIDELETVITPLLIEMGKQHYSFQGFHTIFWDSCPEAILCIWKEKFQDKFTAERYKAWSIILMFIISKLKEGYDTASGSKRNDNPFVRPR